MMLNINGFIITQLNTVSAFGTIRYLTVPTVLLVFVFLMSKGYRKEAVLTIIGTLSFMYAQFLKGIFLSDRPLTADLEYYTRFDIYGFPSGHVLFYTVFFGFILYLVFKLKKLDKLLRMVVFWICVYFIVLVGASRIALGAHYLKDVIGGYFFGLFYLGILIFLNKKFD